MYIDITNITHLSNLSPRSVELSAGRQSVSCSASKPVRQPYHKIGITHPKNNCDHGLAPWRGFRRSGFRVLSMALLLYLSTDYSFNWLWLVFQFCVLGPCKQTHSQQRNQRCWTRKKRGKRTAKTEYIIMMWLDLLVVDTFYVWTFHRHVYIIHYIQHRCNHSARRVVT